ncbi:hypothetical protein [Streptomyces sp. A5-4]|uniref:hypothetical protein n=1 Tax=Streptomyces sp. A5-4 TaxID=3384771 RepID=UPI003DA8470B
MGFPNAVGATDFLRAFRSAVFPSNWRLLNSQTVPPVLLRTGGEGERAGQRSKRVLDALEESLKTPDGRAVAFARPQRHRSADPGQDLLTLHVGRELPRDPSKRTGRLKLRDFDLVDRLVEEARGLAAQSPDELSDRQLQDLLGGATLRNQLYERRVAEPDGLPHALAQLAPPVDGSGVVMTYVTRVVARPLFYRLPRRLWSWRWKRRLLTSRRYGWYRQWLNLARTHGTFFDRISEVLGGQAIALRGNAQDQQNALLELEKLLLRAMLADLHRAHSGRVGPWKRRRRTRRVVLLDLPAAAEDGGKDANRFLQAYRSVYRVDGSASLLVVGAGQPDDYVEVSGQRWHQERAEGLAAEAQYLLTPPDGHAGDNDPWLLLPSLADSDFDGVGLAVARVQPPTPVLGPRAESSVQVAVVSTAVVALVLGATPIWRGGSGEDTRCLDGSKVSDTVVPEALRNVDATQNVLRGTAGKSPYRTVVEQIEEVNNKAALAAERRGATVRTVVYLGSSVSADKSKGEYNGAVAELRGVWLAQIRLNSEAAKDPQNEKVQLIVGVRDSGKDFVNAPAMADDIVEETRANDQYQDHRTIVGVVGFAESRYKTLQAARKLSAGRVPLISTTATADEMQTAGQYYRPMAPGNSRESQIAADFALSGSVIEEKDDPEENSGYCESAVQAVVVSDPSDLYSKEIGGQFAGRFGDEAKRIGYPDRDTDGSDVARRVCAYKKQERRTVLYWASRVESFNTFLDNYNNTGCAYQNLTVIAGNELTNAALAGEYTPALNWLRLYHTAHVLPVGHPQANGEAKRFARHYAYYAGEDDPWRSDGHGPLGYDAYRVLSWAIDGANASNRGEVNAAGVKSKLDSDIELEGVSGAIMYPEGNAGSKPPVDKGFVIVGYTKAGPQLVLHCGKFSVHKPSVDKWGPNGLDCPKDE